MNKEWRPEGWDNPHSKAHVKDAEWRFPTQNIYFNQAYHEFAVFARHRRLAYEAGADAMLDKLFKLAEESPTKTFEIDSRVVTINDTAERDSLQKLG